MFLTGLDNQVGEIMFMSPDLKKKENFESNKNNKSWKEIRKYLGGNKNLAGDNFIPSTYFEGFKPHA